MSEGEGCEIIKHFVLYSATNAVSSVINAVGYKANCNTDIQLNVYLALTIQK
jgi:hypothetical protein